MYKVEKNVPVPKDDEKRQTKYPWAEMKFGDSFFVPAKDGAKERIRNNLNSVTRSRMTFHKDERHIIRAVEGGYRVWRVK